MLDGLGLLSSCCLCASRGDWVALETALVVDIADGMKPSTPDVTMRVMVSNSDIIIIVTFMSRLPLP